MYFLSLQKLTKYLHRIAPNLFVFSIILLHWDGMYRWNSSMGCNNVGYVKCFILIEDLLYICVQISLMVNAAIWGILKNIMANTRIKKYIDDHISYNRLLDIFVFWLIFYCDNDYEYSSNEYPNRRQVYNKNYPLSLLIEIHSRQPQKKSFLK